MGLARTKLVLQGEMWLLHALMVLGGSHEKKFIE